MPNVNLLFPQGIVPNAAKIKSIAASLNDCLGVSFFSYGSVDSNGQLIGLGNCPEIIEIYHETKAYLVDPHISHPHLLRSGFVFIPDSFGAKYMEPIREATNVGHILMILIRTEEKAECYHFGMKASKKEAWAHLFNHIDLFYHFIRYFKREAKLLIQRELAKGFNIKETRGDTFTENDFTSPLLKKDPKIQKFLKLTFPLTEREQQCFQLFKEGKSAQMTGAILGISQRTVESYFDNIKNKLGCYSKADLLQF